MKNNNMEMIDSLDKLQRADHDTIIRIESKVNDLSSDIRELKDTVNMRVNDVDTRLRSIERVHEKVNLENLLVRFLVVEQGLFDFKKSWKIAQTIMMCLSAITGFILASIAQILNIIKH